MSERKGAVKMLEEMRKEFIEQAGLRIGSHGIAQVAAQEALTALGRLKNVNSQDPPPPDISAIGNLVKLVNDTQEVLGFKIGESTLLSEYFAKLNSVVADAKRYQKMKSLFAMDIHNLQMKAKRTGKSFDSLLDGLK